MNRLIIDQDTGVVVGRLEEGDRIVRKESVEHLNKFDQVEYPQYSKLRKMTSRVLNVCNLSGAETIIFLTLAEAADYKTQIAKHDNGKMITRDALKDILDMNYQTVKRSISKLIKHGLIVEANTEFGRVFIVNPFLICKGNKTYKTVTELFKEKKWSNILD